MSGSMCLCAVKPYTYTPKMPLAGENWVLLLENLDISVMQFVAS